MLSVFLLQTSVLITSTYEEEFTSFPQYPNPQMEKSWGAWWRKRQQKGPVTCDERASRKKIMISYDAKIIMIRLMTEVYLKSWDVYERKWLQMRRHPSKSWDVWYHNSQHEHMINWLPQDGCDSCFIHRIFMKMCNKSSCYLIPGFVL